MKLTEKCVTHEKKDKLIQFDEKKNIPNVIFYDKKNKIKLFFSLERNARERNKNCVISLYRLFGILRSHSQLKLEEEIKVTKKKD